MEHAIDVVQNLIIPEAQHRVASVFKVLRAPLFSPAFGRAAVLAAVDLDYQARLETEKICDRSAAWVLATELDTVELAVAQSCP